MDTLDKVLGLGMAAIALSIVIMGATAIKDLNDGRVLKAVKAMSNNQAHAK